MNTVDYFFEDTPEIDINNNFTVWLNKISEKQNKDFSLNYIFCDDAKILKVNKAYLDHDYYTDIITFDLSEEEGTIEADIFISIDTVKSNAEELNCSFEHELARVMSHGVFHLLGFNDKTDSEQQQMRSLEDEAIQEIL